MEIPNQYSNSAFDGYGLYYLGLFRAWTQREKLTLTVHSWCFGIGSSLGSQVGNQRMVDGVRLGATWEDWYHPSMVLLSRLVLRLVDAIHPSLVLSKHITATDEHIWAHFITTNWSMDPPHWTLMTSVSRMIEGRPQSSNNIATKTDCSYTLVRDIVMLNAFKTWSLHITHTVLEQLIS